MVEANPQPDEEHDLNPWIGIDLGTTNSCISFYSEDKTCKII